MFGNVALDVAISLIFIYLLYSLLASIVQELIARIFNLRARFLTKALRRMLEDGDRRRLVSHFTFFSWFYELIWTFVYFFTPFKNSAFLKKFYGTTAIYSLGESSSSRRPSYISPALFSQTLLHMFRGRHFSGSPEKEAEAIRQNLEEGMKELGPETREYFLNLLQDARHDVDQFRLKLEQWFDEAMARTNGWYRKQIQTLLIIIGFIIAWQFNVDSIAITRILTKDKKAREEMVTLATQRYEAYGQLADSLRRTRVITSDTIQLADTVIVRRDTTQQITLNSEVLDSLYRSLSQDAADIQNILGISRNCEDAAGDTAYTKLRERLDTLAAKTLSKPEQEKYRQAMQAAAKRKVGCYTHPYQQNGWLITAGWLLTALAISLGAPFWFDLLNKIVKIRTGGQAPPPAAESKEAEKK